MSEDRIEAEHHTQAEAEAIDAEHHPVADPPEPEVSVTVPRGTRTDDEYGAATHVERINPDQAGPRQIHRVLCYAPDDHPEGMRWPYTLMRPAFTVDHVRREPGYMVWLLPHEVAAFHRLVDRSLHQSLGIMPAMPPTPSNSK